MKVLLALVALTLSCAVDPKAAAWRRAEGNLQTCLAGSTTTWHRVECGNESRTECLDAGFEPNCAIDWTEEGLTPW